MIFFWILSPFAWAASPIDINKPAPKTAIVSDVYDGDTYTLRGGEKVRLRGVNTPEIRPKEAFGIEARDAMRSLLLNQTIELRYGEVQRDGYGRLVASVRTQKNQIDAGEFLLQKGLGHVFLIPPEGVDVKAYLAAQAQAKTHNRGLWSLDRYKSNLHMTSFHANAPGNDRQNINGEYLRVCNISQTALNLKDYFIENIRRQTYPFPDITIPAGHTVKVISGVGRHQTNPEKQLELYLGSVRPIWNNKHDRATIYSPARIQQDSRKHKVSTD